MSKTKKRKATAAAMPLVAADEQKMGRPALFHKPLPKTFMMSEEASTILDRKAEEMKCSRSDVLEAAIRYFNRKRNTQ